MECACAGIEAPPPCKSSVVVFLFCLFNFSTYGVVFFFKSHLLPYDILFLLGMTIVLIKSKKTFKIQLSYAQTRKPLRNCSVLCNSDL